MTTATSLLSSTICITSSTLGGNFTLDKWTMSPGFSSARSTSMYSGRSFGRQETSTSVSSCEITTPAVLPAGDVSLLRKCSGTLHAERFLLVHAQKIHVHHQLLEWMLLQSRTSTFCTLPSTFRSRIEEKNHSFFDAKQDGVVQRSGCFPAAGRHRIRPPARNPRDAGGGSHLSPRPCGFAP